LFRAIRERVNWVMFFGSPLTPVVSWCARALPAHLWEAATPMSTQHRLMLGLGAQRALVVLEVVAGAAGFVTAEEESSGVIDTKELLGDGTFLFDAQVREAHPDLDQVVEYGRLLRLRGDRLGRRYQAGQPTRWPASRTDRGPVAPSPPVLYPSRR
jgi:hypothetical protein